MNDQLRRRSVGAPAARSVLLTILGEYVMPRHDALWQETLIDALGTLGYKPQAARQALARSVTAGWLRAERIGRRSRVDLTAETSAMLETGARRIYAFGSPWEWDGRWLVVVLRVPEERRDVRHQAGRSSRGPASAPWAAGCGSAPTPSARRSCAACRARARPPSCCRCARSSARWAIPARSSRRRGTSTRCPPPTATFIDDFARRRPRTPEAVFAAQTMLVHEWRKFPFLDPDLPAEMLPAGWPRERAHDLFADRHEAWSATAQDYFGSLEAERRAA